jgi:hypothetical protein
MKRASAILTGICLLLLLPCSFCRRAESVDGTRSQWVARGAALAPGPVVNRASCKFRRRVA